MPTGRNTSDKSNGLFSLDSKFKNHFKNKFYTNTYYKIYLHFSNSISIINFVIDHIQL